MIEEKSSIQQKTFKVNGSAANTICSSKKHDYTEKFVDN